MSGIYIPGMEMPKSCSYCLFWEPGKYRFADCLASDEAVMCRYGNERPDECPLVPVPDHGRLIDERALLAEVLTLREGEINWAAVRVKDICNAPTIIPADPADKEGE